MNLTAYRNTERKNKKVIVYLHTYSGNKTEGTFLFNYLPAHFDLALFDLPGCGNSKAQYATYGLAEKYDLDSVLRKLEAEAGYREFTLWGRSMGAAVVSLYAEHFLSPNLKEKMQSVKKSRKQRKRRLSKLNRGKSGLPVVEEDLQEANEPPARALLPKTWKDKVRYLVLDSPFTNLFEMIQGGLPSRGLANQLGGWQDRSTARLEALLCTRAVETDRGSRISCLYWRIRHAGPLADWGGGGTTKRRHDQEPQQNPEIRDLLRA